MFSVALCPTAFVMLLWQTMSEIVREIHERKNVIIRLVRQSEENGFD